MKNKVIEALSNAVKKIGGSAIIELTPAKGHGDFATNIAMKLTKELGQSPIQIAEKIISEVSESFIDRLEIAGPGFINIFLSSNVFGTQVEEIISKGKEYGKGSQGKYINIEFVSANPTGHLHVGHARGAAVGATLANVLEFAGNKVDKEYYINDAGNQIDTLGISSWTRYQQELGVKVELPEDCYAGQDIVLLAKDLVKEWGSKYKDVPYEEIKDVFKEAAKSKLLDIIKDHLKMIEVDFDLYFSETSIYKDNLIKPTLEKLTKAGHTIEKDGALWLNTTAKGDDKDRVLIKSDGTYTYLTPDVAYHDIKISRGYDELINVWGADHIGYIKRMEVALEYLGLPSDKLDIFTIQLVKLIKDGKELKMSKRKGTAFSLEELTNLVGKDAVRFHMVNRAVTSGFDFDLDEVIKQSSDNPVFTIQYTHARANQIIDKKTVEPKAGEYEGKAIDVINLLTKFPELVESMAKSHKIHLLPQYLIDVAREFNSLYSNTKIIGSENESSLLALTKAVKIVIRNGLQLLGVDSPDKM